jgi:hypothetical protein
MKLKSESGVSELIGAILLVSLVVMLMMVVTTVIISQPRPEKVPELSVFISNGTNNVTLTHMGGDTLLAGEYMVVIDGNIIKFYYESSGLEKQEWSFEKPTIIIHNQPTPKTVELYYNGLSNKVLLAKTDLT